MKLRVRSAAGGPTHKIQVSFPYTLQDLKDAIAAAVTVPASSLQVSLNKKDRIEDSGNTPLSDLGVRGGDLVFFSGGTGHGLIQSSGHEPGARASLAGSSTGNVPESGTHGAESFRIAQVERSSVNSLSMRDLCAAAADRRASVSRLPVAEGGGSQGVESAVGPPTRASFEESQGVGEVSRDKGKRPMDAPAAEDMDVDSGEKVGGEISSSEEDIMLIQVGDVKCTSSIPDLLSRVLAEEGDQVVERPAFLFLAVHAVMLETGFVRVESSRGPCSSSRGFLGAWNRNGGIVNLQYSLPELLEARLADPAARAVGNVLLRCQIMGNAFIAYGTIAGAGGSEVYRLCLPISKFLCGFDKHDGSCLLEVKREPSKDSLTDPTSGILVNVFDLWKEVKDGLSLPLFTDLCGKAGLPPPPSLLMLPTELKIKILEFLPAQSLAALACVCSELKFLSSGDELWKVQFQLEFAKSVVGDTPPGGRGWKAPFIREWLRRKRIEERRRGAEIRLSHETFQPFGFPQRPLVVPFFGGDYDRHPGFPFPAPGCLPGPSPGFRRRHDALPAAAPVYRGPLGNRLGPRVWSDLGGFGREPDDLGDDFALE